MTSPVTIPEPYEWLTQGVVEREFGIPRSELRKARRRGDLHTVQRGRAIYYLRCDVREWCRRLFKATDAPDTGVDIHPDSDPEATMEKALKLLEAA